MTPDLEAVIARGKRATEVLGNDAFRAVVDDLTAYHLAQLCSLRPGDGTREQRDYHHLMQHGLAEIVGQLQGWAEAGKAAEAAQEDLDDEDLSDPDEEIYE